MSAGQKFLDFAGYPAGAGAVTTRAGFLGLLDFSGYPVGAPSLVPPPVAADTAGARWAAGLARQRRQRAEDEDALAIVLASRAGGLL